MENYPTVGHYYLQKATCRIRPGLRTLQQVAVLADKYLVCWAVDAKYWEQLMTEYTGGHLFANKENENNFKGHRTFPTFWFGPRKSAGHDSPWTLRPEAVTGEVALWSTKRSWKTSA